MRKRREDVKEKKPYQIVFACNACDSGPCKAVSTVPYQEPEVCPYRIGDSRWRQTHSPADDALALFESMDDYFNVGTGLNDDTPNWVWEITGNGTTKGKQLIQCIKDAADDDRFFTGVKFEETERGKAFKEYTKANIAEAAALESFQVGVLYAVLRMQRERDGTFEEESEE